MTITGNLLKMSSILDNPVQYLLPVGSEQIPLNPYLEKTISLTFTGQIHCVACGRKTNKSFNQGYCFPCLRSLAECDMCIVKPEQCHFDQGTCRDEQWAQGHCMQEHIVYLANSSGLKVGITRHTQVPTRWIDQGAVQAIPVFKVKNRYISGLVEVVMKEHVSDRTDWRKMLKGESQSVDLMATRDKLLQQVAGDIESIQEEHGSEAVSVLDGVVTEIQYPVQQTPEKVKSLNFDKTPEVSGVLMGIKGQYLILDAGVINIRKFSGYEIEFGWKL
ncbi:MAG: DUF2797 domain-containing protein [Gammaproteobacteria bacterium]|nr:DUF2797 domain-containing protein [Gammaproteobacteria bacterium]MDH5799826.1 DUF2797 domain-containing protein [Gammaproteobacteria bacterium]